MMMIPGQVDSKVCNETRVNYKKTLPAVGFDSPPPQAPKRLFQREEHGVSPTFASSRKSGQRNIRELFPQAQRTPLLKEGPARGQVSYSQAREGISREARGQPAKPKDDTAYTPFRREKEFTWSGSPDLHLAESIKTPRADSFDTDAFHGPSSSNRGSRHRKATTTKLSKMTDQLNNQEKIAAATIAVVDTLRTRQEEELSGGIQPQDSVSKTTDKVPVSTPSPQTQASSFTTVGNLLSEMATLQQHAPVKGTSVPLSEVTPSISTADSLSALSSVSTPAKQLSTGKSSLNTTSYPGVPHGHLPGNKTADNDGDIYSLSHRIIPGCACSFWFLQVGFDIYPIKTAVLHCSLAYHHYWKFCPVLLTVLRCTLLIPSQPFHPSSLACEPLRQQSWLSNTAG
jgi:hypothetical protein